MRAGQAATPTLLRCHRRDRVVATALGQEALLLPGRGHAPDATSWFVRTGGPVLRTTRSPRILNVMIILLTCTTHAGCSNGDGAMSTASIMPPSSPAEVTKPDALSRPLAVAWTSLSCSRSRR